MGCRTGRPENQSFDLENLYARGLFSDLDYFLARFLTELFNESHPIVQASCALVSRALREGHVCLDLNKAAQKEALGPDGSQDFFQYPKKTEWVKALNRSAMVSPDTGTPLVLDEGLRLYLARYYDFQRRLVENLGERLSLPVREADQALADEFIDTLVPGREKPFQAQKNAIRHALLYPLTIISGGPGSGKTHVSGLIRQAAKSLAKARHEPEPRILCVAPTGKAASRMEQGRTIHAALKPLMTRPGFHFNKTNPLPHDLVLIDEASMIDLPLMVRLLEALPLAGRVILIGDRHQLSSVQAGAVFGDLCAAKALAGDLFVLDHNFRSGGKTGIEKLSRAINEKKEQDLDMILTTGQYPDIVFESLTGEGSALERVYRHIREGYGAFAASDRAETALARIDDFKVLCAHNQGDLGTLQVNHVCEKILRSAHESDIEQKPFFKIVMVNTNDYKKGLFNGDTGVISEETADKKVFFKGPGGAGSVFRSADLPAHDTAWAITVHKSQGAEFGTVLILLPDRLSPVVTRQLLYTGVTRAREKVILAGRPDIIKKAVYQDVVRHSGIVEHLDNSLRKHLP